MDLSHSFLIFNGLAYDYFNNRAYGSSVSSTTSIVSSRNVATKQVRGSGGASTFMNGNAVTGDGYAFGGAYGNMSAYASASTNYSSSSVTDATTSSSTNSVEYVEKQGVWVPAHSSRVFNEFTIMSSTYRQCGLPRDPSNKEDASVDFSMNDSPITFENRLMLEIGDQQVPINNIFYISNITNVSAEKAIAQEPEQDCKGNKTGMTVVYNIYRQADRFYLRYSRGKGSSDGSNDRIGKPSRLNFGGSRHSFNDGVYGD